MAFDTVGFVSFTKVWTSDVEEALLCYQEPQNKFIYVVQLIELEDMPLFNVGCPCQIAEAEKRW